MVGYTINANGTAIGSISKSEFKGVTIKGLYDVFTINRDPRAVALQLSGNIGNSIKVTRDGRSIMLDTKRHVDDYYEYSAFDTWIFGGFEGKYNFTCNIKLSIAS